MATNREVPSLETNAACGYGCKPTVQNDLAGFALGKNMAMGQEKTPQVAKATIRSDYSITLFMSIQFC